MTGARSLLAIGISICAFLHPLSCASAGDFRLLDPLDETKVQAIETFVAAEAFKVGNWIGRRTVAIIGLNFAEHFLQAVERQVPAVSLKGWTLRYTMGDRPLIAALGGELHADLRFLAIIHRIMEMGEEGPSHNDGRSNFAYLRSPVDRRLWAVHWFVNDANQWVIGAVQVPHPQLDWRSRSRLIGPTPSASPDDVQANRANQ